MLEERSTERGWDREGGGGQGRKWKSLKMPTSIFITGENLNVSKTNYMIMCNRGKKVADAVCNIEIDGKIIERISQCKFLGLIVDDKLTWKCHIDYICSKVSKLIGILIRARKILPICSLITLYNSLLNPYFTYRINIYGEHF